MRIVVPYARLHYLCKGSVEQYAPLSDFIETPTGDDTAYPTLFADLWGQGEDFLLIEHDVEVHGDVVGALRACPEPWCGFQYQAMPVPGPQTFITYGLGCTRYRHGLMEKVPLLAQQVAPHWARLDALVRDSLLEAGFDMHVHTPPVTHHHNFYPLGCACGTVHSDARYRVGQ